MQINVQNMDNWIRTGSNFATMVIENNRDAVYLNIKGLGYTPDTKQTEDILAAMADCLSNTPEDQQETVLNTILNVPIIVGNLNNVAQEWLILSSAAKKTKSASNNDDDDEGMTEAQWGALIGATAGIIIGTLTNKPWQNKPANDSAPTYNGPTNWKLVAAGVGAFIAIVFVIWLISRD